MRDPLPNLHLHHPTPQHLQANDLSSMRSIHVTPLSLHSRELWTIKEALAGTQPHDILKVAGTTTTTAISTAVLVLKAHVLGNSVVPPRGIEAVHHDERGKLEKLWVNLGILGGDDGAQSQVALETDVLDNFDGEVRGGRLRTHELEGKKGQPVDLKDDLWWARLTL